MIVCLCKGITDRVVRQVIRAGAATGKTVGNACGAGTACGACRRSVLEILEGERRGAA